MSCKKTEGKVISPERFVDSNGIFHAFPSTAKKKKYQQQVINTILNSLPIPDLRFIRLLFTES